MFRHADRIRVASQSPHRQRGTVQGVPAAQPEALRQVQADRPRGGARAQGQGRHLHQHGDLDAARRELHRLPDQPGRGVHPRLPRPQAPGDDGRHPEGGRRRHLQPRLLRGRVGKKPVFFLPSPVDFFVFFWVCWFFLVSLVFFIYLLRRESF